MSIAIALGVRLALAPIAPPPTDATPPSPDAPPEAAPPSPDAPAEPARGEPERVPDPEPEPPPEPTPEPDPPPEPEPVRVPDPSPAPEPVPEPPPAPEPDDEPGSRRASAAPFADLSVANREAELRVGGDLVIAPRCRDGGPGCNGGRIGFQTRFPVTQASTSGTGRSSVDALDGFAGSWRVGLVGDYIRDTTAMEGPATFWMVSLGAEWGVRTFNWFPEAGDEEASATRHSFDVFARLLHYRHQPKRHRLAPQLLVRYARDWAGAAQVGIVQPGPAGGPDITVDRTIDGPATRPAFVVSVPVLFSIQRGVVLRQLGFGPTVSWAAAGDPNGWDPFGDQHTARLEAWLYWYPAGRQGLEGARTNVRLGVAPYVDVHLRGRPEGSPQLVPGALVEVKVGVRGYEY